MDKQVKPWKLTDCQLSVLKATNPGEPIKDIRTLKKLSLLGVVKLHEHTGIIVRHVWGMLVRAWYIDEAEPFSIPGIGKFREKYFNGSIFPYLVKVEAE